MRGGVAPGSKSERDALVLEGDDGRVLVVRRRGAPTFGDDDTAEGGARAALAAAATPVVLTGSVLGDTLLADSWHAAAPDDGQQPDGVHVVEAVEEPPDQG